MIKAYVDYFSQGLAIEYTKDNIIVQVLYVNELWETYGYYGNIYIYIYRYIFIYLSYGFVKETRNGSPPFWPSGFFSGFFFLQCLKPYYVSTAMTFHISPNMFVPTATIYVKSALATLPYASRTCGYWCHGLQVGCLYWHAVAPARGGRPSPPTFRQDRFWDFRWETCSGGSIINVGKIEIFIYFVKNIGG